MSGWQNEPFVIEVKEGQTKFFCMCGLSKNGPFCDGSHSGTEFEPMKVKFDKDKKIWACGCQKSAKRPYCDGTHSK